jgi:hypothetical protein
MLEGRREQGELTAYLGHEAWVGQAHSAQAVSCDPPYYIAYGAVQPVQAAVHMALPPSIRVSGRAIEKDYVQGRKEDIRTKDSRIRLIRRIRADLGADLSKRLAHGGY